MTYVISDIHGRLGKYKDMLECIELSDGDELYIMGDVVDRGPDGIRILQDIMGRSNVHMLLGNHELMMLRALGKKHKKDFNYHSIMKLYKKYEAKNLWYYNGGNITDYTFKYLSKKDQIDMIDYLVNTEVNLDVSVNNIQYKLVHAAPIDLYDTYGQNSDNPIEYAVWDRDTINAFPKMPYTVIFGHTPTCYFKELDPMKIVKFRDLKGRDEWIAIDCGCSSQSTAARLACLRLEDMKEYYV